MAHPLRRLFTANRLTILLVLLGVGCGGGQDPAKGGNDIDVSFAPQDVTGTETTLPDLPDLPERYDSGPDAEPDAPTPGDATADVAPLLDVVPPTDVTGGDALSCGNGTCDGGESCADCPADCGQCPPYCGNGTCDGDETCTSCQQDCGQCPPNCGNGQCDGDESCSSCQQDCGQCPPQCGDGQCNGDETCTSCQQDCGQCPPNCGNGQCDGDESCTSCPEDCGQCPPQCGDGQCNGDETCVGCPQDCGTCTGTGDCCQPQPGPGCGDAVVLLCVCGQDAWCCETKWDAVCVDEVEELGCGSCTVEPVCGDGACDEGESCTDCPGDCGLCPPPLDPPAGRTNYIVSLGKLNSGSSNNDWVRLGTYTFDAGTHQVTAAMWKWTQASPTNREDSGVQPNGTCSGGAGEVRKCSIHMPAGFKDAPNDNRTGTYQVKFDGGTGNPYIRIDWTPDWYEEWWLPTEGAETYAVLKLKKSDKATVAFAYGSNAPFSERRALSTIVQKSGQRYEKWVRKQACSDCTYAAVSNQKNTTSHFQNWTICGNGLTWVMTLFDPESSGDCNGSDDTSIQYYFFRVSAADRRDGWWFWHTCKTEGNAWNECYGCDNNNRHGGSHTFAMMQVLNDTNQFVGHLGVEVGFDEGSCSNPTEYRYSDVLGVARITPETEWLNDPNQVP